MFGLKESTTELDLQQELYLHTEDISSYILTVLVQLCFLKILDILKKDLFQKILYGKI